MPLGFGHGSRSWWAVVPVACYPAAARRRNRELLGFPPGSDPPCRTTVPTGPATAARSWGHPPTQFFSFFFLYSPSTAGFASSWFSFAVKSATVAVSFSTVSLKLNS